MVPARRKITVRAACIAVLALLLLGAGRAEAITLPADFQDSFVANATPAHLARVRAGRSPADRGGGRRGARLRERRPECDPGAGHPGARLRGQGERGLLGVAVDPDFETNNFIYLFYTW